MVAMTVWPFLAMPIDAALPKPEPAPVTRMRLLMEAVSVDAAVPPREP